MSQIPRACLAGVLAIAASAPMTRAQSVLDHPPNVSGGWVVPAGRVQFNFQHRFDASPPPVRKVTNFPTFLLGVGLPGQAMVGFNYSTNSLLTPAFPNEWELFGRWRPLAQERGAAVDLGGTLAYNLSAKGVDAEVTVGRRLGRVALVAAGRALTNPDTGAAGGREYAIALGATLRLTHSFALQGDYATLADRPAGSTGAWSAGVAIGIPSTPHSLSLYASNAVTSTLQGASRGTDDVRYGFEFTVPLSLGRWFGARSPGEAVERAPAAGGPVRTIIINRLAYAEPDIEVAAGTTVIWRNDDQLEHTVTSDDGTFSSGMISVRGSWSFTFNTPGTYSYHCTPHPFMKGRVVVR